MAHVLRETHIIEKSNGERISTVATTNAVGGIARIVYFIAGIVSALLGLRFILALLGANPGNPFANFIYTVSHPFVSPFFGLFNYQSTYGVSRFELETVIALIVYLLLAWAIVRLVFAVTNTSDKEV